MVGCQSSTKDIGAGVTRDDESALASTLWRGGGGLWGLIPHHFNSLKSKRPHQFEGWAIKMLAAAEGAGIANFLRVFLHPSPKNNHGLIPPLTGNRKLKPPGK